MGVTNLSSLRNDGQVSVNLDSRHLIFILNTGFDLSSFVRNALDTEIDYYEWATTNNSEARELEAVRKERRLIDYKIREAVEQISTLFNRSSELDDDICEIVNKYGKDWQAIVEKERGKREAINKRDGENEYHHMHLEINGGINQNIGIYIPKELHRSIYHNSTTGKGIREINKASLIWLCEQSEI
jgi:hypothetical protein